MRSAAAFLEGTDPAVAHAHPSPEPGHVAQRFLLYGISRSGAPSPRAKYKQFGQRIRTQPIRSVDADASDSLQRTNPSAAWPRSNRYERRPSCSERRDAPESSV